MVGMRNGQTYVSKAATGFAILAAVLLATQHPLTKPVATNTGAPVLIAAVSALISLVGVPLLLMLGKGKEDFHAILERPHWGKLAILTIIAALSIGLYVTGMMLVNQVLVSLVLNTSPLWAALFAERISGQKRPRAFFLCVMIAFLGIAVATLFRNWDSLDQGILSIGYIFIAAVPALYMWRVQLLYEWFKTFNAFQRTAAATVPLGLAAIPFVLLFLILGDFGVVLPKASVLQWTLFLAGTVAGTLGGALLQKAIQESGGSAYPIVFNLAIPTLSALLGWWLSFVDPTAGLAPDRWLFVGIAIVLSALGLYWYANKDRLKRP
jgi:drug/metabolite transporter (DMT)-like permease